jgi:hypothetical protein
VEYVKTYSNRPGPALLGDGASRETVSAGCREAALAFMSGVAAGWDKLDLVMWLTGPYAGATAHLPRGERVAGLDDEVDLDDEAIEELATRVRSQLIASLERAAMSAGLLDFAEEALDRGFVRKASDVDGYDVWLPVDGTRMRLRDRVRSLFAADFLNDPSAYLELYVCPRCEAVVFDEGAKRLGLCAAHKRASGIVPREDAAIPKVAGED